MTFSKTNTGQKSFIGPLFRNQIPESLKKADNLNTFMHNLKKHSLNQINDLIFIDMIIILTNIIYLLLLLLVVL